MVVIKSSCVLKYKRTSLKPECMEVNVEEKITVNMTADYLFDFTLYHTYSKFAGFLTNVLGFAIAFMGIIMTVMGKIQGVRLVFYLLAAAAFIAYTPLLLKMRAKKQVQAIEQYSVPNVYTFGEEGITVAYADKEKSYAWERIQKVITTPKTIGFYYEAEQALIVPKADFGDRFVPVMTMVTQHVAPGSVRLRS